MSNPYREPSPPTVVLSKPRVVQLGERHRAVETTSPKTGKRYWIIEQRTKDALGKDAWLYVEKSRPAPKELHEHASLMEGHDSQYDLLRELLFYALERS